MTVLTSVAPKGFIQGFEIERAQKGRERRAHGNALGGGSVVAGIIDGMMNDLINIMNHTGIIKSIFDLIEQDVMLNGRIIAFDIQAHEIIKLPGSQRAGDALDRLFDAL